MASTRNHLADPVDRFVTDFTRLVRDFDRLLADLGGGGEAQNGHQKTNGHARVNGHAKHALNGTISTVREHVRLFVKTIGRTQDGRPVQPSPKESIGLPEDLPHAQELMLNLSRAQTMRAIAETVMTYCRKCFGSPAGIMFVERNGDFQVISRHPRVVSKTLADQMIKNGPVARTFRTGKPLYWPEEQKPHSKLCRHFYRLLPQSRRQDVTFLPIAALGQQPVGVLALILPPSNGEAALRGDRLRLLGEIVSGFVSRARAYDEANAARISAESDLRKKDEFLSVLSHELKNPMMPILGWAVALSSGTLPADKQNLALEGIVRNVRTLNYLIEDLFDAARLTSGKLRLQRQEIRIQEVAREALTAIQHTAEAKKLRISTDISEGIPTFLADPRRLRQALMNLLNNALKFTSEGGSIALKVFRRGESVECIVSDTGKGIESKFLPFVFDRFSQERRSTRLSAGGLGLGLAIVREIVELHGGAVRAFSEGIDKGATFVLRLPMRGRRSEKRFQMIRSNSDIRRAR